MSNSNLPNPLDAAALAALGLADFDVVGADLAPGAPSTHVDQGRVAPAAVAASLSLAQLLEMPDLLQLTPLGLPGVEAYGWQVHRGVDTEFVLYVQRLDNHTSADPVGLPAERVCNYGADGQFLDLRNTDRPLVLRSGSQALLVQVANDRATSFHALAQPLPTATMPDLTPPALQWASATDTWLTGQVDTLLASRDPINALSAAAMTYRFVEGGPLSTDPPPALAWARQIESSQWARLEALLAHRAERLHDRLEALAEHVDDTKDWCTAVERVLAGRAQLAGCRELMQLQYPPLVLDASLAPLDRLGQLLVAALPPWPVQNGEDSRRAWLADPDAWWTQYEAERANSLEINEEDDG